MHRRTVNNYVRMSPEVVEQRDALVTAMVTASQELETSPLVQHSKNTERVA